METQKSKVTYNEHRWFNSEIEKAVWEAREKLALARHVAPYSTFVAAMGNHWREGCYDAVKAMCKRTWDAGYIVTMSEQQDRCFQPYDGLGVMRNLAYMRAISEGYEYILYVDNDVKPEPETLLKLLRRHVSIISPVILFADGLDHGLTMPKMPRMRGLAVVKSCVLSFLLFKTSVFFPWSATSFWDNPLGADEDYHFRRLAMAGHFPFVDTDISVMTMDAPHFPLDKAVYRTTADLDSLRNGGQS